MSVPCALASKNEPLLPGTRIMSPNEVMMVSGWEASAIASSTRPIGITQTGQPGPCTSVIGLRQVILEPVLVDGVRVPAAHLHQLVLPPRLAQSGDLRGQGVRLVRRAEFVNEAHHCPLYSIWDAWRASSSSA